MSKDDKGYSSYPELQQHFNSWRSFASAEPAPLNEGISHAMSSLRVGKGQSEKAVPVKGEIVDTAFTEFVSKLQQISKRVIGPINDEQLMQEFQAFLRAQGFVVQGMDVDAGKYANMAEDLSSGSMEYDKDSGSPMLGNLEKMVKNYELFGSALVKACQSKYIGQITTSMERFGFGDVREFLEQVKALTPAQEEAPENDLLKRLLAELVQAGTLEDWGAIWEQLRKTLEKEDASEPWERILAGLNEIKEKARTEAEATENLEELAKVILQLGIEDQEVNRAAAQRFIKLAWDEFFEGAEYGAGEEEEDLIQKLLRTRDLDEFGEVYAELATKTNKENQWQTIVDSVQQLAQEALDAKRPADDLSGDTVIQQQLTKSAMMVSKFDYNETPGPREHFMELANQFLKMVLEPDANQGEEAPFDLANAASLLPHSMKVWEMLVAGARRKADEPRGKKSKPPAYMKFFAHPSAIFKNDANAFARFIEPFASNKQTINEEESIVPGPKTIKNLGNINKPPFFTMMVLGTAPGVSGTWQTPFKNHAGAMVKALDELKEEDQNAYYAVLRMAGAMFSAVRYKVPGGKKKGKALYDKEKANELAKARQKELLKLVSKIQNSAQDSTEQPTPDSVKPPEGAEKKVIPADKDTQWDFPQQQVAETLDRWKTLAGIITESEEK